MNRLNLRRIAGQHGAGLNEPTGGKGNIDLVGHSRNVYGYAQPPRWTESDQFTAETASRAAAEREFAEGHPVLLHAGRAMTALLRLDRHVAEADADRMLSDLGKREKLKAARADAARSLAQQAVAIRGHRTAHDQRLHALYDPAVIAKDDLASLLLDREARDHWRDLNDDGRMMLAAEMASTGAHDRIALALLRGLVPLANPYADLVSKGWRAAVAKREPSKAAQIATETGDVQWAESVIDATKAYITPMLDDRAGLYRAVRELTGGPDFYDFAPGERGLFEHQIAAAKAAEG